MRTAVITRDGLGRMLLRLGVLLANAILFGVAARTFDPVEMGIWSLASAMTSIVMSLDLGVANYVRNQVIFFEERKEEFFSAGIWFAIGLAIAYSMFSLAVYVWWPIGMTDSKSMQLALPYLTMSVLLLALRLPSAIGMNCFFSFNEANFYNAFEFSTMFASVVIALTLLKLGFSIHYILVGFYGVGTVVGWLALLFFIRRRKWTINWYRRAALVKVFKGAWPFGLLQIVGLGLSSMPTFVISSLIGIEDATAVRATVIISQAILSLHLAHAMPLWTAFSRIYTMGGMSEMVVDLQGRLAKEVVLLGLLFLALSVISPQLIDLWVGRPVSSFGLCLAFSLWAWGCGVCNLYSLVLNGRGRPLMTVVALLPGTLLIVALAELLAGRWGSAGVGVAFAIGASISAGLMAFFGVKEIRRLTREEKLTELLSG